MKTPTFAYNVSIATCSQPRLCISYFLDILFLHEEFSGLRFNACSVTFTVIGGELQRREKLICSRSVWKLVTEELGQTAEAGLFVAALTAAEGQLIDFLPSQIWTISPVIRLQVETKFFPGFDLALVTFAWIPWPYHHNFTFTNFANLILVVLNFKSKQKSMDAFSQFEELI